MRNLFKRIIEEENLKTEIFTEDVQKLIYNRCRNRCKRKKVKLSKEGYNDCIYFSVREVMLQYAGFIERKELAKAKAEWREEREREEKEDLLLVEKAMSGLLTGETYSEKTRKRRKKDKEWADKWAKEFQEKIERGE